MPFGGDIPIVREIPFELRLVFVRLLIAFVVFIIFWLLRHAVLGILMKPFYKLADITEGELDEVFVKATETIVGYLIIAISILIGIQIVGLGEAATQFFQQIAVTLIAFGVARFVWSLTTQLLSDNETLRQTTGIEINSAILPMTRIAIRGLTIVLAALIIAQTWNLNIGAIAATVGLAGVAISLAAKEVLDDFIGFAVIIGDDIYRPDEFVVSPYGEGVVEQIGMRSTQIRQLNQGLVTIPNSKIADDWVVNWSRLESRWFNFYLGVTYSSTPEQIDELANRIRAMLESNEHVLADKGILVTFLEYGDSALNLLVRCWHDIADYNQAQEERHRVNLEIMRIIDNMNLSVALPSRSLYVEQLPDVFSGNGNYSDNQQGQKSKDSANIQGKRQRKYHKVPSAVTHQGDKFSQGDSSPEIHEKADPDSESEMENDSDG